MKITFQLVLVSNFVVKELQSVAFQICMPMTSSNETFDLNCGSLTPMLVERERAF